MSEKPRLGLALCGSYCTYDLLFAAAQKLKDSYELIPIMSETAAETDSRVGTAAENIRKLMKLCGMQDYAARKTMDAARRFRPEFCKRASELIVDTDYKMKTSFDDRERLLELLVLQLAQEARSD